MIRHLGGGSGRSTTDRDFLFPFLNYGQQNMRNCDPQIYFSPEATKRIEDVEEESDRRRNEKKKGQGFVRRKRALMQDAIKRKGRIIERHLVWGSKRVLSSVHNPNQCRATLLFGTKSPFAPCTGFFFLLPVRSFYLYGNGHDTAGLG